MEIPGSTRMVQLLTSLVGRLFPVALSAILLASPLGAQEGWDRVRSAYGAAAADRMRAVVEEAIRQGVPPGLLVNKALEGAAKGVTAERVLPALTEYAGRLGRARSLFDGAPDDPTELVAAADAIRRGVPEAVVTELVRGPSGARRSVSLIVLGDLVEAGVPVEHARSVVEAALARGKAADVLLAVPSAVQRMIREGWSPAQAATQVHGAIGRGVPPPFAGPREGVGGGKPPVPPGTTGPRGRGQGRRPGG